MSSRPQFPLLDAPVSLIDPRNYWIGYLIAAGSILSIGLALSEPSASSGLGLPARIVFWLAHVASALFFFELVQICLGRIAIFERLPPFWLVMVVGVAGSILFSAFSLLLLDRIDLLVGDLMDREPLSIPALLDELRDSGIPSVLFWLLLNSPRLVVIAQQQDADVPSTASDPTSGPTDASKSLVDLLSRLPRRIGTDIVAISAELHYLRVYTRKGEALILMSFGRAVKALGVIQGQSIHRSHWVALAHVVGLVSDGDRVTCQLDTGLELPVSRTYRSKLRSVLAMEDQKLAIQTAEKITAAPESK